MSEKKYRHELKHYINYADWMQLRSRLRLVAGRDANAGPDGSYKIRSLYFDNYRDKALVEKLAGVSEREKFRLRYYDDNLSFIRLEKKSKKERLVHKEQCVVTAEICEALLAGDCSVLRQTGQSLCEELYSKMQTEQLRPRTIVDYTREAYVYGPGNVRITIDSDIRMSNNVTGFLEPYSVTIPSAQGTVLEVKFDEFLPDIMRDMIQLQDRSSTEFSKYVVARLVC